MEVRKQAWGLFLILKNNKVQKETKEEIWEIKNKINTRLYNVLSRKHTAVSLSDCVHTSHDFEQVPLNKRKQKKLHLRHKMCHKGIT